MVRLSLTEQSALLFLSCTVRLACSLSMTVAKRMPSSGKLLFFGKGYFLTVGHGWISNSIPKDTLFSCRSQTEDAGYDASENNWLIITEEI